MQTRMIREKIREFGTEQGIIHVLETMNESIVRNHQALVEIAKIVSGQQDTLMNVVNGVHGMRANILDTLVKKGIIPESPESAPSDGMDENTQGL
jgi:hypothetical protein